MDKHFFKRAAVLVLGSALLSVLISVIYFTADKYIAEGSAALYVFDYLKKTFDYIALFTGYATVIFAFAKFGVKDGLWSIVLFSGSFLISILWQIVGTCIYEGNGTVNFIVFNLYYSFGSGFITQMVPAFLIALFAYKFAFCKHTDFSGFISLKTAPQKAIAISTLVLFGINLVLFVFLNVLPTLIEEDFYITVSQFGTIMLGILDIIIYYLVVQYIVYYFVYRHYADYTKEI